MAHSKATLSRERVKVLCDQGWHKSQRYAEEGKFVGRSSKSKVKKLKVQN
jgi:hypothetical protein